MRRNKVVGTAIVLVLLGLAGYFAWSRRGGAPKGRVRGAIVLEALEKIREKPLGYLVATKTDTVSFDGQVDDGGAKAVIVRFAQQRLALPGPVSELAFDGDVELGSEVVPKFRVRAKWPGGELDRAYAKQRIGPQSEASPATGRVERQVELWILHNKAELLPAELTSVDIQWAAEGPAARLSGSVGGKGYRLSVFVRDRPSDDLFLVGSDAAKAAADALKAAGIETGQAEREAEAATVRLSKLSAGERFRRLLTFSAEKMATADDLDRVAELTLLALARSFSPTIQEPGKHLVGRGFTAYVLPYQGEYIVHAFEGRGGHAWEGRLRLEGQRNSIDGAVRFVTQLLMPAQE
jgi:hypothetical protein